MGAWLAPGLWEETLPQRPPEAAGRQAAQEAWPRMRDLDFLSASREPGQVVALCLSHSPPAFPAPTHTEAPSPHRLPAQAPLSLCEPQGLTCQAGMHSAICREGCGGAAGWGKGRAAGGSTVAGGEKPKVPPACWLRFSLGDFLPCRCREPSWRAMGPLGWRAGCVPAGAGNWRPGLRLRWW